MEHELFDFKMNGRMDTTGRQWCDVIDHDTVRPLLEKDAHVWVLQENLEGKASLL